MKSAASTDSNAEFRLEPDAKPKAKRRLSGPPYEPEEDEPDYFSDWDDEWGMSAGGTSEDW